MCPFQCAAVYMACANTGPKEMAAACALLDILAHAVTKVSMCWRSPGTTKVFCGHDPG